MKKQKKSIYILLKIGLISILLIGCEKEIKENQFIVKDIDGNVYHTITVGSQVWMKENLKTTRYNDGTPIPNVLDNNSWTAQTIGSYCWYDNDIKNKETFGALYNWYAVVDSRKLCPAGWHIPTNEEWTKMETYLGGSLIAGGKLKATTLWYNPNTGATNESGFSALPGGYRNGIYGDYNGIGNYCYWWLPEEYDNNLAQDRVLLSGSAAFFLFKNYFYHKSYGYSVRCVRDY